MLPKHLSDELCLSLGCGEPGVKICDVAYNAHDLDGVSLVEESVAYCFARRFANRMIGAVREGHNGRCNNITPDIVATPRVRDDLRNEFTSEANYMPRA